MCVLGKGSPDPQYTKKTKKTVCVQHPGGTKSWVGMKRKRKKNGIKKKKLSFMKCSVPKPGGTEERSPNSSVLAFLNTDLL